MFAFPHHRQPSRKCGACVNRCVNLLCYWHREVQGGPDAVAEGEAVLPPLDTAWAESTRKKALLKLEKLDTDLKNYKGNSIKESIRYMSLVLVFIFANSSYFWYPGFSKRCR